MKRLLLSLLVLSAAGSGPAAEPLTLADALERAAEHNPALAARRFDERAADALVEQAGVRPNPSLDVTLENVLGTGVVQGVRRLEATVQASQLLERGGKREKRLALAERERALAAHTLAVRRADVLATTAAAYVDVLAAQERVTLAEAALALAHETLAAADARVRAGEASPAEAARARIAIAVTQAEVARSQAALAGARAALAANWGGPPAEVAMPARPGRIRAPVTLPDEASLRAALARHPRLELQQAEVEARRAAVELEQARAVQDVTVGGGVRFLREGTDAAFVAGVSLPLPFRRQNDGNIRAARETLAGAELATRAVARELDAAFTAAWQELLAAHAAALALRRDALPATEEAHVIVQRAYAEGQLPLIDVLDAQRALGAARRELFDAEAACVRALARVEALTDPAFTQTHALLSSP